jgi:hypothetical protein
MKAAAWQSRQSVKKRQQILTSEQFAAARFKNSAQAPKIDLVEIKEFS